MISLLPLQAWLATLVTLYLVSLLGCRRVMLFAVIADGFLAASVILEQDTSNRARLHPEVQLTDTNVFPETHSGAKANNYYEQTD